jgi:hypothetical protein
MSHRRSSRSPHALAGRSKRYPENGASEGAGGWRYLEGLAQLAWTKILALKYLLKSTKQVSRPALS